jgi:hypothetical protein
MHRTVSILVELHEVLVVVLGAHRDHHAPSGGQLVEQRVRGFRRGCADVNGVEGSSSWVASATVTSNELYSARLDEGRVEGVDVADRVTYKLLNVLDADDLACWPDHVRKRSAQVPVVIARARARKCVCACVWCVVWCVCVCVRVCVCGARPLYPRDKVKVDAMALMGQQEIQYAVCSK